MDECEEIAVAIWRRRSPPIRSYADAEEVARLSLPDQGSTIRANVAEALFELAEAARRR